MNSSSITAMTMARCVGVVGSIPLISRSPSCPCSGHGMSFGTQEEGRFLVADQVFVEVEDVADVIVGRTGGIRRGHYGRRVATPSPADSLLLARFPHPCCCRGVFIHFHIPACARRGRSSLALPPGSGAPIPSCLEFRVVWAKSAVRRC